MFRLRMFTLRLFVVLTLPLLISSCSWMTRFIITNAGDAPVKLSISAETIERQSGDITCPIDHWSHLETNIVAAGSSVAWQRLPQERYKLNQQPCSVEMEILPSESVSLSKELNYSESGNAKALFAGKVNALAISTKDGEILITGAQIAKHFVRVDKFTYRYTIK